MYVSFITEPSDDLRQLWRDARRRRISAFRPGTRANHLAALRHYLAFCMHYGLQDLPATPTTLVIFAEFLLRQFKSGDSVRNTVAALKTCHKIRGLPIEAFLHFHVTTYLRSLNLTVRHVPKPPPPFPLSLLASIAKGTLTAYPHSTLLLPALLTLLFHTFIRLSSAIPATTAQFDPTRHLCIGDVIHLPDKLVLLIKWGKAHQKASQHYLVPLSPAPGSPACPVASIRALLNSYPPLPSSAPLFSVPPFHRPCSLSRGMATTWLRAALVAQGLSPTEYTFHSLRRGGSTAAVSAGVPLNEVQTHGAWASSAVLRYVPEFQTRSRVASTLASLH